MGDKLSLEQINEKLSGAKSRLVIGGIYSHYKNAENTYKVLDLVMIEATQEVGVIYEALYADAKDVKFLRPLESFLERVEKDGEMVERFKLI